VLGSDGMDFSTQVSIVRRAWVPVATSYRARHLMSLFSEDPAPATLPGTETPRM
jgi:hypothetical protein